MARKKKLKARSNYDRDIILEILSIIFITISFFSLYSLFCYGGFLGALIKNISSGLFGIGAYFLPIFVLIFSIYILFADKKFIPKQKIYGSIIFLSCPITFAHIINNPQRQIYSGFWNYISINFFDGNFKNGGLLGAVLGDLIINILGSIGAYIFLASVFVISFMLLTNKSLFKCVGVISNKIVSSLKKQRNKKPKIKANTSFDKFQTKLNRRPKLYTIDTTLENSADKNVKAYENQTQQIDDEEISWDEEDKTDEIIEDNDMSAELDDENSEEFDTSFESDVKKDAENQVLENNTSNVESDTVDEDKFDFEEYQFPPIQLLNKKMPSKNSLSEHQIQKISNKLVDTLKSFGVAAQVVEVSQGPTVTRYELSPGKGVKVSKISGLADDLALSLAASGIRIEAPVPGKSVVGIEVPNEITDIVLLREIVEDKNFTDFPSKLAFGIGKDIAGKTVVYDIAKMPHLLIAGATGSGKSVCINTLITSLIYKAKPDEVKLLMIDPKVVELGIYNGIPHLLIPVVTDPQKAAGALNWAVKEMTRRYSLFAENNVRDMKGYNAQMKENGLDDLLPQIVIIIDELADLMMVASKDVESAICRLAQMARAAGLHLIIATQRPSVDVITGLIKANIPSRLAFSVTSGTDSRTILDMTGAEKLLGKGDMLFHPMGSNKPQRIQGAFVSDKEVENIVNFVKKNKSESPDTAMIEEITSITKDFDDDEDTDEFFEASVDLIMKKGKASTSMLQRQFRIGYNRAARIMEELENRGIVGPEDGSKPRQILMSNFEWEQRKQNRFNS